MVVPSSTVYFPSIIRRADAEARQQNVRLVLSVSHYGRDEERECVRRMVALGIEGILLTPAEDADTDDNRTWLESLPVPVVLVERTQPDLSLPQRFDHVSTDHAFGALIALRHFARLGYGSIALALNEVTPTATWWTSVSGTGSRHSGSTGMRPELRFRACRRPHCSTPG